MFCLLSFIHEKNFVLEMYRKKKTRAILYSLRKPFVRNSVYMKTHVTYVFFVLSLFAFGNRKRRASDSIDDESTSSWTDVETRVSITSIQFLLTLILLT